MPRYVIEMIAAAEILGWACLTISDHRLPHQRQKNSMSLASIRHTSPVAPFYVRLDATTDRFVPAFVASNPVAPLICTYPRRWTTDSVCRFAAGSIDGRIVESVSSRTPTSRSRCATADPPERVHESHSGVVRAASGIHAVRRSQPCLRGRSHAQP